MQPFKGVFIANTATGNQAVTGASFTPKVVIIWTSYQTATGYTDGYQFQIGMTDGTRQNSWAVIADDNTSPNDTNRRNSTTAMAVIDNVAGTTVRSGAIVSLDSGGFTINWTTQDSVAAIFHWVAFGGADLYATVSRFNVDMGSTNLSAILTTPVSAWLNCITVGQADAGNGPTFGWGALSSTGAITQGCAASQVRDAQTTSITGRYQRTSEAVAIIASTTQTIPNEGLLTNFGYFPTANVTTAGIDVNSTWLGGCLAKSGSGLQPTSTGTQAITSMGFTPKIVFLLTVGQTAQTTIQTEARFSLGAYDGTNQGYAWTGDNNGVNPSVAAKGHSITNAIVSATPAATGSSTTTLAEASVQSLDTDGFTLNWTTADATQREYLWFAIGNGANTSSSYRGVAYG